MYPNKLFQILVVFMFAIVLFSGCTDNISEDVIDVLITILPQKEMVETIGGSYVSVSLMVPPGQTPHFFELTPEQLIKAANAKVYFIVGSGVEFELGNLNAILDQNPNIKIFDCSTNINVVSFNEHYGQVFYNNDSLENISDDHKGTDPHIWTSPLNFKKMAKVVYDGLSEIDPDHTDYYYTNYQNYIIELDQLHSNISSMLNAFSGRSFIVYHPSWGYFGDTYHLRQIAIEEDGKQPGPADVAALITQAKELGITVIFVSPQFDISNAESIANEINGVIVTVDPLMSDYETTLLQLAIDMVKSFK